MQDKNTPQGKIDSVVKHAATAENRLRSLNLS